MRVKLKAWIVYSAIAIGLLLLALLAVFGALLSRHPT